MANKETRVLKQDTLEILRQKTNEISLHVGDNVQLDALLADKTYNYTAAAGQVLFDGADNNSKVTRFELSPQHTVDNTGGSIILEDVSSIAASYAAGATIYQGSSGSETYQATIVSATTNKIIVRDSTGTFSTSADLKVGTSSPDTIANAKIARIIIESYPVAIARVYNAGTELTQGITANGFYAPKIVATSALSNSPSIGNSFSEGVTVYQNGTALNTQADIESSANWYGVLHSVDNSDEIRFKTAQGSFSATAKLRVLGSSDEIAAADHAGLTTIDTTYGSYIELVTPAAGSAAIKIFSLDIVAAINELQDDIGTVENLTTSANDVVLAINEHDGELGTITAAAMGTTASTVSTAIKEHEDQIGNVDITGISGSNDTITGALEQLHNEVGNVTSGNLGTSASNLTSAVREHEDQIGNANINSISSSDNTIKTALNQLHTEVGSLSLNTSASDLTAAINEHEADIGNMTLTGLSASDLSAAVRELRAELGDHNTINDATGYSATTAAGGITELQGDVGDVTSLDTNATADLVAAINELENVLRDDTTQRTGYVMGTNANNVIAAINEFETVLRGANSNYTLNTAASNVRDAINEHETQIGNLVFGAGGPVDAANSTVLTGAINVLDAEIGSTSFTGADLTTAIKNTQDDISTAGSLTSLNTTNKFIVGAINEIEAVFDASALKINANGNFVVDSDGDITLDAGGANINFSDDGTAIGHIEMAGQNLEIKSKVNNKDILFKGVDDNSEITSLQLDMSDAGTAIFNHDIKLPDNGIAKFGASSDLEIYHLASNGNSVIKESGGGVLSLQTNGSELNIFDTANNVFMAQFQTGGRVSLRYAGTTRFATAADGADVTGQLDVTGDVNVGANLDVVGSLTIDGTTLTATVGELNVMDGNTSATSTTLVDADRLIVNDNGVMKQVGLQDFETYFESALDTLSNVTTVGHLNSGSITAGFGNINIGSSTITTSGSISGGAITGTSFTIGSASINEPELERIDGLTIGTITASKVVTVNANKDVTGFRNITLTGELDAGSLDISGNIDTDGTLDVLLGSTLRGAVNITDTTASSSTTTGALKVAGGVGIGEDLYVAGDLYVEGDRVQLDTQTLTVEDTLVLAGNNLSSEPASGGFGLEVGPITNPSGVADGVTGAHSIVYNFFTDQWEADGSLILSSATLGTPSIEGTDFGSSQDLAFSAGAGLSETVTGLSGNNFVVTYTNTDRGSSQNIFKTVAPSSGTNATADVNSDTLNLTQGSGISTIGSGDNIITITNTDLGSSQNIFKTVTINGTSSNNVVADSNSDTLNLRGLDAITLTSDPSTDTISIDHNNFGTPDTYGQTGTQDGQYIKSIITNAQGHVTGVTTGDFDTRYQASNPAWNLKVSDVAVDSVANGESVDFRLAQVNSTDGLTISTTGSTSSASIITLGHADTSSIANLTSNNSGGTVIQDLTLTYDTYGHALTRSVATTNLDNRYIRSFQIEDGDNTEVTIDQGKELKFVEGSGTGATIDINWSDTSTGSDADPYDLTFTVNNTDRGSSQNIFKNVASDSGTAVADNNNDTLSIVGGTNISTAVTGDTLTITNDYAHPTNGVAIDVNIDSTPLSGATVISDLDFRITSDSLGHVTLGEGTISTRNLTLSDLGFVGWDVEVNGVHKLDVGNNVDVDFKNGNHTTAVWTTSGNRIQFDHNTFTSGGTYTGGSNNGIVIEGFHIDSFGHIRNVQTRDLDSRFDNYLHWHLTGDSGGTAQIDTNETVTIAGGNKINTVRSGNIVTVNLDTNHGFQLDSSPATFFCVQNSGSNDNPKLQLSDQGNVDPVTIVGGNNVTVTRNSNTQLTIAATDNNTDVDVSVANLRTRLGQISTNTTIGDASDVDITFSGDVIVNGDLTISGSTTTVNTETVTVQDNIILLNSNASNVPTENAGLEVERGNSPNVDLIWNEGTDRWSFTNNGSTFYNIPIPTEYMSGFVVEDGDGTEVTIGDGKELKFVEGTSIDVNFTDTSPGSNADPFDLTISHKNVGRSDPSTGSVSLAYDGNFSAVTGVTSNSQGHITAVNTTQFTMPSQYSLPLASSSTRGGIKIGYSENGKNYPVELSAEKAYVNVPWSDTNTFRTIKVDTTNNGSANATLGATEELHLIGGTNVTLSESDGEVTINAAGYTLPVMTSTVLGGAKVFSNTQGGSANAVSSTAGRTYGVQLNSSNQLVVNVPWTDTDTNTNRLTTFVVEDGDSSDVTISHGKHWKFVEGSENVNASGDNYININWTDTSTGTEADEYDLSFSHKRTSRSNTTNNSATTTFGGNFTIVDSVTTNATGHVTAVNTKTITMPANPNTDKFLNDVSIVAGNPILLRHTMNDSTSHDIALKSSGCVTLTAGTDEITIGAPCTDLSNSTTTTKVTVESSTGNNTDILEATSSRAGVMTSAHHDKLDGIEAGADVNQNAFSTIAFGGSNCVADSTSDTFTINAGSGISLTGNATSDTGTISVSMDQRSSIRQFGHSTSDYIIVDADSVDFFLDGVRDMSLENDGELHVRGDVIAFSTTITSDEKLKENVQVVNGALELVSQLDGVTFNWKENGKASAGVIAQDVEQVLPSAVKEVENMDKTDTHKVVDYNQLSALFIEAIKELKEENKILRAEIESLKDINS